MVYFVYLPREFVHKRQRKELLQYIPSVLTQPAPRCTWMDFRHQGFGTRTSCGYWERVKIPRGSWSLRGSMGVHWRSVATTARGIAIGEGDLQTGSPSHTWRCGTASAFIRRCTYVLTKTFPLSRVGVRFVLGVYAHFSPWDRDRDRALPEPAPQRHGSARVGADTPYAPVQQHDHFRARTRHRLLVLFAFHFPPAS